MSHRDTLPVSSVSEEKSGLETSNLPEEEDQKRFRQKTNVARLSKAETTLELAECGQAIEDELLEASLEEYQYVLASLSATSMAKVSPSTGSTTSNWTLQGYTSTLC